MGSCTGKLTKYHITLQTPQSPPQGSECKPLEINKGKSIRKNNKQKAVGIDPRVQNDTYEEVPNASVQDIAKTEQEVRQIVNSLKIHFIFSSLKSEYKSIMVHHMKHFFLNPSDIVFEQGKPGNNFYVVSTGKLEVIINSKPVTILKPGDSFGEMALVHDTLRTATVMAIEKSSLWGLDRKTFRKTLELLESANYQENKQFIETISIFETLTPAQKEALVHAFSTQYFNPGTKIIREGDPGELLYIIKEGNVLCTRGEQEIRRVGKGSYFGEQALIYNELRTATVTAIDNVKCIVISGAKLSKVLGSQLQSLIYQNSVRIALERNHYFKKLTKEQINILIDNVKVKTFQDTSIVISTGTAKSSNMWIVVKGTLIKDTNDTIAKLFDIISSESMIKDLDGFFEHNIIALGETDIAFISKEEFKKFLGGDYAEITASNEALKVLKRVQILRGIDNNTLEKILKAMKAEEYNDGDIIFQQNDPGDAFFIVKTGTVEAFKDNICLRTITKHDYFGERSLIFNDYRSATVKSKGKATCWKLLRSDFTSLIEDNMRKQLLRRIELQDDSISLKDLVLIKQLGSGMFGNVFLAAHKSYKRLFALKSVDRKKIIAYELQESIVLERRILMQLDHTFIMKLIKTFKDENRLYFLIEFIHGTDLFEVIRKLNLLTENDARFYIGCIIDILEHLHEREILYRDLKPENIVVDDEGYPKLIDFGTAKFVKGRTFTIVGTPHYMAPEVINGHGYGLNADYWSVGIMLYEFLFGLVPFGEDEEEPYAIYQKIQEHNLDFPAWMDKNSKAKDMIGQLLSKNPAKRTGGSNEILKMNSWFSGFDWEKLLSRQLKAPLIPQVQTINNVDEMIKNSREMDDVISMVEAEDEVPLPRKKPTKVKENWDEEF